MQAAPVQGRMKILYNSERAGLLSEALQTGTALSTQNRPWIPGLVEEFQSQRDSWHDGLSSSSSTTLRYFIGGKSHGNADALSCVPCTQCGRKSHSDGELPPQRPSACPLPSEVLAVLSEEVVAQDECDSPMRTAKLRDAAIGVVLRAKESGKPPKAEEVSGSSRECRLMLQQWDILEIRDGVLW
jgi:hypothetical protein